MDASCVSQICYAGKVKSPYKNTAVLVFMNKESTENIYVNVLNGVYTVNDKYRNHLKVTPKVKQIIEEKLEQLNVTATYSGH